MRYLFASIIVVGSVFEFSPIANAVNFTCQNVVASPYAIVPSTQHDHSKYAPAVVGQSKEFAAFFAVFD